MTKAPSYSSPSPNYSNPKTPPFAGQSTSTSRKCVNTHQSTSSPVPSSKTSTTAILTSAGTPSGPFLLSLTRRVLPKSNGTLTSIQLHQGLDRRSGPFSLQCGSAIRTADVPEQLGVSEEVGHLDFVEVELEGRLRAVPRPDAGG